jgi:hypothetical protein
MLKILFILLLFVRMALFSQNKWEIVEDNFYGYSKGSSDRVKVIQTLDSNNCFVVTDNGRIFHSINQGKTWEIILSEKFLNNSSMLLEDAAFINTNIFFLVNYKGFIYSTRDGGKTFDSIDVSKGTEIYWLKMFNEKEGIANAAMWNQENPKLGFFYTKDSWKSWDTIENWDNKENGYTLSRIDKPFYHEDKLLFRYTEYIDSDDLRNTMFYNNLGNLDIENKYFNKYLKIPNKTSSPNYFKINNNYFQLFTYFPSGKTTSYDGIIKYDFNSKKWRRVLEMYYVPVPWGLQDIAFKNDSVGIAVGQSGKIIYTYDAGESWYYETEFPFEVLGYSPRMLIEYAGDYPIVANNGGIGKTFLIRLKEDNLAPQPQDTLVISGYVKEDEKPQAEIPVELDNRYTMTDSNGYYQFIHIRPGKEYNLKVYEKHYSYEPYLYHPDKVIITTYKDTTINFQATDKRIFHNISGNVYKDWEGLPDIPIQSIKEIFYHERVFDTVYTNEDGFYHFDNIEHGFKYTYKPLSDDYTFDPPQYSFATTGDQTGYRFHATPHSSVTQNPNFQLRDNVIISEEVAGMNYRIISLSGRVVKSATLPKELNLNAHPTGTYILHITKGEQIVFTHKFQVVR